MEPGTKFCPDHRDLKPPPYADYCSVCNRRLVIFGTMQDVTTVPGVPFQTDEVAGQSPEYALDADGIPIPTPEEEEVRTRRMMEAGDLPPAPDPMDPGTGPRPGADTPLTGKKPKAKKSPEPDPVKSHHKGKH